MAQNLASTLDLVTTICFLLLDVTKFPPSKMQYAEVDFIFIIEHVQSVFVYTSIHNSSLFFNTITFLGVYFR